MNFEELDEIAKASVNPIADVECLRKYWNDQRDYYHRFLYQLVAKYMPMYSIEIGVHRAVASAHMARAANVYGGTVIGIDINDVNLKDEMFVNVPDNCIFLKGDSTSKEISEKVQEITKGCVGLIFQDSSHHYVESHKEFEIYSKMLTRNGIWVCDDITPAFHDPLIDPPGKGMEQYFDEVPGQKTLYENLHYGSVIGVIL